MEDAVFTPLLIDIEAVAKMLGVSSRHCLRLAEAGKMPPGRKLGRLRRWSRDEIEAWCAAGCPSCRAARKGGER